jgi:hypothetical protein
MESYYSPQLLQRSSTEEYVLIGTGGETHGGGLYALDLKCFTTQCSNPVEFNSINNEYLLISFSFLVYKNYQ